MLRRCRQSRWLWLAVVFLSVSIVTCADCTERHHHHHHHHQHHYKHHGTRHSSSQPELQLLSSSQLEKIPSLPLADMGEPSCPNCVLPDRQKEPQQQSGGGGGGSSSSDEIRLETIKRQILSKLGLKEKPNVTSPVPREVIMETLYRAEETGDQQDGGGSGSGSSGIMFEDDSAVPPSTRPPESEPDDFYGRTSEIIAFAEPGHTLNGQTLLEFSHAQDLGGGAGGAGSELRVKAATLWVRVDFRSPLHRAFRHNVPDKNLTLWVFTVTQQLQMNATHLSGIRRVHGDGGVAAGGALHAGLAEVRPDGHGARLVLVGGGGPRAPEAAGGLLRLRRARGGRPVPRARRGRPQQGPAAAVPGGAHRPHGDPASAASGAGLHRGPRGAVLQAAVLRQLQTVGLGRLDHCP
ncbi:uncharacterized protein Actbeta isoform X2 [Periplaneta americana]|uniref:uncharacterized protein Actbeta isoform X2 n=1 Tax=Periplaneta americana TaxID=6978 RepID=UPI0037E8E4B7